MQHVENNILIYSFPDTGKTYFNNFYKQNFAGHMDTDEIYSPDGIFAIYGSDFEDYALDIVHVMLKHQVGMCVTTNLPKLTSLPFDEIYAVIPLFSRLIKNRHNFDLGRDRVIEWYQNMINYFIDHSNRKIKFIYLPNDSFLTSVIEMKEGLLNVRGEIVDSAFLTTMLKELETSELFDKGVK